MKKILFLIKILCALTLIIPLSTNYIYASYDNSIITPYAAATEWHFQYINGVLYKRLYNVSTLQWIGEWIRVSSI